MAPINSEIRYDAYENESVIIYDDVVPSLVELIYLSNVYYVETQYPGKIRYRTRFLELKVRRTLIVLSNYWPEHHYWSEDKMPQATKDTRRE